MVEIRDEQQLEAWLDGKPREVSLAIVFRAAFRVVPIIHDLIRENIANRSPTTVLPLFRSIAASWLTCTWPNQGEIIRAAAIAAHAGASNAADDVAISGASAFPAYASLVDSAYAVTHTTDYSAHTTAYAARSVGDKNVDVAMWANIMADAKAWETGVSTDSLMHRPLWADGTPAWANGSWEELKNTLLAFDEDWRVWTDWYEDRLLGADHPNSRALIVDLELKRVLIPDADWEKGPKHVNGIIAALEVEYRAKSPPQRSAIIEVEPGDDGKIHRRPSRSPTARDDAQEQRLRAAWEAHSQHLAALEEMDPGRNSTSLGRAMKDYRAALGSAFDAMDVIALGVHGSRLDAYAARADALLLEDAAAELVALAAAHGLFMRQFDAWLDYVNDASGEPSSEMVQAAVQFANSTRDDQELIDADVSGPIGELAAAAEQPLAANPEDRPPRMVERELLRSVGNVLSGVFAPLVAYARDGVAAARKGSIRGIEDFTKKATLAIGFGGSAYIAALAAGLPGEFGWIIQVLKLLKMKLGI